MLSSALPLLFLLSSWGWFGSVSGSSVVEEVYRDVVSLVSPGQQHLTEGALRSLFNTLENRVQCGEVPCGKCDPAGAVHQLFHSHSLGDEKAEKNGENVSVSVSQFPDLAAGAVLYLSSPELVCASIKEGKWGEKTEQFLHNVTHHDHDHHEHTSPQEHEHSHSNMDVHGVETVFVGLGHHYQPSPNETCVTPGGIMAEVNASSPHQKVEVGGVLGRILYHALLGRCFTEKLLPEKEFFMNSIMNHIGSEHFQIEALKTLMKKMKLGPLEDDHDHDHDHDHGHDHGHRDGHNHADHNENDGLHHQRLKRSSHEHRETHNSSWEHHCFTAEELLLIYALPENGSSVLGRSDVDQLSPAFIQQILSKACTQVIKPTNPDSLSTTEKYLYATIANVIITLTAMFGIVILLFTSCTSAYQMCLQFCISLAVGSLTGDALLHLLPMVLGLHLHSHEDGDTHDHSHEEVPEYFFKILVVVAAIYFFYLLESILTLVTRKDNHDHQHSHGTDSEPHHCDHLRVLEMYQKERIEQKKSQATSEADLVDFENGMAVETEPTKVNRLLPLMITIGDGIHNFADGLAMGAAFSVSLRSGLATSLAVFCHELPHELGDFAILLHSGLSIRKALLLNVGSALVSFGGLYIALSHATDVATQQWIAAVTTGLFLYVGLADMLPTLVHINSKRPWLTFALQNAGLVTGWILLVILSLYEGSLMTGV